MKQITFTLITLVLFLGFVTTSAKAAEVVGSESYEVSWQGIPGSDKGEAYQVYYGQVDGNRQGNTVFNGLTSNSRDVRLNNLKPCTAYSWSLKSRHAGSWTWVLRDRRFTTGGNCGQYRQPSTVGSTLVQEVNNRTGTTGQYSSSTINWSQVPGAAEYHIYYRPASSAGYVHSLKVPSNATRVTINYLTPGVTYYYRIAAVVNGNEQWLQEKMLQQASGVKPVLGTTTKKVSTSIQGYSGILGDYNGGQVMGKNTCTTDNKARISFKVPSGIDVSKIHVLYGTEPGKYAHAIRNLESKAREVTIGSLNTCQTYYYQIAVVASNGRVHWQGEKMMNVMK